MAYLEESDLFLVTRGSKSYKITTEQLRTEIGGTPARLSVSKGVITPTYLEVNDTFTGTANVSNAKGTIQYRHEVEKSDDGVNWTNYDHIESPDDSAEFTAELNYVRYRMLAKDDVTTEFVEGDWSEPIEVINNAPNATMHGLRFDKVRDTYLQRSPSQVNDYTLSVWVKLSSSTSPSYIFAKGDNGTTSESRGFNFHNNALRYWTGTVQTPLITSIPDNVWTHIVVSREGNTLKPYKNGVLETTSTVTTGADSVNLIGKRSTVGSPMNEYDGYLSDYYFVDGQALEPTAFGKFFDDKWGPLDSSDVLPNIAGSVQSPSETSPNYAQKWSDGGSDSDLTGGSWANAFDGVLTAASSNGLDTAYVEAGDEATITFDPALSGTLRIWAALDTLSGTTKVTLSDGTSIDIDNSNQAFKWHSFDEVANITSLTLSAPGSPQGVMLAGIELDGRILIDGPADNSQVWSDQIDDNAIKAFNNQTDYWQQDSATTNTWTTKGLPTLTSLKFQEPGTGDSFTLTIDNDVYGTDEMTWDGVYLHVDLQGNTYDDPVIIITPQLDTVAGQRYTGAFWSKVFWNDVLLLDSAAKWNTSQVWSKLAVNLGTNSYPAEYAFNGSKSNLVGEPVSIISAPNFTAIRGGVTSIVNVNLPVTSSISIIGANSALATTSIIAEATDGTTADLSDQIGTTTIDQAIDKSLIGKTLKTITFTNTGTQTTYLASVIVDDEVLVDGGSIGANGFYLPFDPDAAGLPGYTWSTGVALATNPEQMFDGDLTNLGAETSMSASSFVNFEQHFGTIIVNNSLELYGNSGEQVYIFNDDPATEESPLAAGQGWYKTSFTGQLKRLEWKHHGGGKAFITGVRIDGYLLIDGVSYSAIGADASGNDNHFAAENFSTFETGQPYSTSLSPDDGFTWLADTTGPEKAFNGVDNDKAATDGGPMTFERTFVVNQSFEWWMERDNDVTVFGDLGSFTWATGNLSSSPPGEPFVVTRQMLIDNNVGTTVNKVIAAPTNGNARSMMYKFVVDGTTLLDTEASATDLVFDTPMKNYAVLTKGKNGNLENDGTSSNSTYKCSVDIPVDSTDKYYSEFTWISATSGEGFIFFVEGGSSYYISSDDTQSGININGSTDFDLGDIIGIAFDPANAAFEMYKNGVSQATGTITTIPSKFNLFAGSSSTVFAHNYGQQPFVYDPPADHISLYQTWEQWARTTIGYLNDRVFKLESDRRANQETVSALTTELTTLSNRLSSIESGEVDDDAIDNVLLLTIQSLTTRIEALES